ncbi:MAG: hypothetical protein R3A10_15800 [Caldilineaceae bacterium]
MSAASPASPESTAAAGASVGVATGAQPANVNNKVTMIVNVPNLLMGDAFWCVKREYV